ncbi:hypothetical protein P3T73_09590 [Kiritimatiellota bacterium B12222]|nr:hypothetical protein P3T73_09590 [Kiritimatiellota bacterium B12222]
MNFEAPFVSIYCGVLLLALYGLCLLKPDATFSAFRRFARSVWPGRILVAICLIWFALKLNNVDVGRFNELKKALWVAVPAVFYLIITFIPDLLSVRGICLFMLLAGQSILIAVRWQEPLASYAVGLLVYALIIKSMFLVVYPHYWIRSIQKLETNLKLRKIALFSGVGMSVVLILCGVLSF